MPGSPLGRLILLLSIVTALLVTGCASSESSTADTFTPEDVLGTWRYQVTGNAPLYRGVFHITSKKGRLQGIIRDQRLGRIPVRVRVHESNLRLTVDRLEISGRYEDGRYRGFLRYERWDASMSARRRRTRRASRTATFVAERIRKAIPEALGPDLTCEPILRENNGCP